MNKNTLEFSKIPFKGLTDEEMFAKTSFALFESKRTLSNFLNPESYLAVENILLAISNHFINLCTVTCLNDEKLISDLNTEISKSLNVMYEFQKQINEHYKIKNKVQQ